MKQTFIGIQKQISGIMTGIPYIFLTTKENLSYIKLMAISLFIILILPVTSSLEFILDYPKNVNPNEEFIVIVNADTQDKYDVKIFINEAVKEYSVIYNEGWKSPHFYLNEAFPEKKEFKLKAYYNGTTKLCVRLRKSGENTFTEKCQAISINSSVQNELSQQSNESSGQNENYVRPIQKQSENNQEQISQKENLGQDLQKTAPSQFPKQEQYSSFNNTNNPPNKLILNPPSQENKKYNISGQNDGQQIFISNLEKYRLKIVYSFIGFCVLIIILLALKRL